MWQVAGAITLSLSNAPTLIYDSLHLVIHSPPFSPCFHEENRQTKQTDRRTASQTNKQRAYFNWCWCFCRIGAVLMIDLSCSVHRRFKEKTWAQRLAHEFKDSVKLSPPAVTLAFDWFKSSSVNSVSSIGVCDACGYRYLTVGHLLAHTHAYAGKQTHNQVSDLLFP